MWWLWSVDTQPVSDFHWYFERARGLAAGQGYTTELGPTAYWPVGYPYALSVMFRIFGASILVAKLFNAACCLICSLLTAAIVIRTVQSQAVGFLAGLAVSASPGFLAYSGILASEPLYTMLILISVLCVLEAQAYRSWILAGVAIGIATLARPQAILSAFALRWVPQHRRGLPLNHWIAIPLCLIIALLITSPWIARNKRTHGKWIFISTNGGDNLWIGHNPMANGRYMMPPGRPDTPENEVAIDAFSRYDGAKEMIKNWPHSVSLIVPKLRATFASPSDIPYWAFQTRRGQVIAPGMDHQRNLFLGVRRYSKNYSVVLGVAALLGLITGWFSESGRRLIGIALPQIAAVALVTVIFFGNGRFALPTVPFQVMLALGILTFFHERLQPASAEPRDLH